MRSYHTLYLLAGNGVEWEVSENGELVQLLPKVILTIIMVISFG